MKAARRLVTKRTKQGRGNGLGEAQNVREESDPGRNETVHATLEGSLGATPLESASEGIGKLTARDIEIVEAVVAGYSDREIASQLSTTEVSIERQLSVIFDRLKVSGRLELALSTIERGLLRTC